MITVALTAKLIASCLGLLCGAVGCSWGPGSSQRPGSSQGPGSSQTVASPAGPATISETPAPGDHDLTLQWDGLTRTYKLHAPPSLVAGAPLPLVVALPYRGGDGPSMRSLTELDAKADREGFLVAYPDGIRRSMSALTCCGNNDDVGFVRSIVEHLVAVWRADAERVYATGMSIGAEMTFRLAVEAPGVFAAIAPVSGGFIGSKVDNDPSYRSSQPVSVLSIVGNDDQNRERFINGLEKWQERAGCQSGPAEWIDPGHSVYRFVSMCADSSEVASYTVLSMGHQWPGGADVAGLGDRDTAINAADIMWEFFLRHPRIA
jgi:polyhydroxybutyrate depolymerase